MCSYVAVCLHEWVSELQYIIWRSCTLPTLKIHTTPSQLSIRDNLNKKNWIQFISTSLCLEASHSLVLQHHRQTYFFWEKVLISFPLNTRSAPDVQMIQQQLSWIWFVEIPVRDFCFHPDTVRRKFCLWWSLKNDTRGIRQRCPSYSLELLSPGRQLILTHVL